MNEHKRRASLIGPAILIIVGVVFLLNNLGWTAISVWDLLRLWPILLIAAGLDLLIGRRSMLGSVLALAVMLVLLVAGVWLLPSFSPARTMDGEAISESLGDASRAEVDIGFGAGTLLVGTMSESNRLVEGTVELYRGERLARDYRVNGGTARLKLDSKGQWTAPFIGWEGQKTWDLEFNRDVPIALDISVGAGDASIDLGRMNLSELNIDLGVGRVTVVLPRRGDLDARIDGGVGELIVQVPEGMEVRVHTDVGLVVPSVPSNYDRTDDGYASPGYAGAEDRIDLTVEAGVGRLVIQRYEGE